MSISIIINGLSQAILRIVFGLKQLFAVGLILGNVIAQVITTLYLIVKLRKFLGNSFNNIKFSEIKRLAFVYKNFPLFDAPARLTEFAISHLPLIVLSYYWAREDIGSISMVVTLILMPISLIGSAMGNVYYKEISVAVGDEALISSITLKAAKITFFLSLLPILFLSFGGDKLLVILLGEKWEAAGKIALCLSIYSLPVILSEPLLPIFRALDKQKVRFKLNLMNLILSVGSLLVTPLFIKDLCITICDS
jgi:O-antigen/teichoic acid export membrane protein